MAEIMKEDYSMSTGSHKKIDWVNIDMADNGYVVEWSEKEMKPDGCMDHCGYLNRKQLFPADQSDEAWDKFKELKMLQMKKNKDH